MGEKDIRKREEKRQEKRQEKGEAMVLLGKRKRT